jgi:quinoprotein glucose dehydrogenase
MAHGIRLFNIGPLQSFKRPARRRTIAAIAAAAAALSASAVVAERSGADWRDYLGGADSAHYSPLKQIDRGNAGKLQVAWTYPSQDSSAYAYNPLVAHGVAYVIGKGGQLVALDAATGKELWARAFERPGAPGGAQGPGRGGGVNQRGLNYWESADGADRRIILPVFNQLQELDARTGELITTFGDNGLVDLRVGLGRDPQSIRQIQSRTPGRVFENLIIVGSATGEGYISPPGDLRAYDVLTGKLVWTFHTVPRPGEPGYETWPKDAWKYIGGVNAWGEISVDEKRGIAYFPLGSPTYDFYGADRKGDGLYGNCLLALDARTGKHLWHFQLVHHDIWDYDNSAAPQLVTVRQNGRTVDAVAQATKGGFVFVFDRVTGKPLWPIEERKVPASDMPGEVTSPTQPFPTAPPAPARQRFTADDVDPYYLTPEENARMKERVRNARNDGVFTPVGFVETIQMPGNNGGSIFFHTAANPASGTVYVISKNVPSFIKLTDNPRATMPGGGAGRGGRGNANPGGGAAAAGALPATPERQGRAIYEQNCQRCHGADLKGSGFASRLEGIVARVGEARVRDTIERGEGDMPSFGAMPEASMTALLAFLSNTSAAPPGSAVAVAAPAFGEVPYPEGVEHPPARYYTGYGYETVAISPPWSTLTAYDLNKGTIKWQVPFGDNPAAGPARGEVLRGNLWPKSGIAVTASGLILFASNEGKLRILDAADGKQLAMYDLPNGAQCVPAVYEVNGREYILINATGPASDIRVAPGGVTPPNGPRSYVAFALPSGR